MTTMSLEYAQENVWFDKWRYDDAECQYYEKQCKGSTTLGTLANQIAKAREEIQNSLASNNIIPSSVPAATTVTGNPDVLKRITGLEDENKYLKSTVADLEKTVLELAQRISAIECGKPTVVTSAAPVITLTPSSSPKKSAAPPTPKQVVEEDEDDDEVDLFGSDDEEENAEAARAREEVLKRYAEKKAKKPGPIAKSSVLLDCKPWDDETDLKLMETEVRKIKMDGLLWGAAKQVPLAFGIHKLSILCTVEDEKVSIDDLSEQIQSLEDYVQSVDIAAFNKI